MGDTGPVMEVAYGGKIIQFYNQRSTLWDYPYGHDTAPKDTLHDAGCGLFSLSHAVQWMTGQNPDPKALSDFARTYGGRGDDGTDRPALLSALMREGKAQEWGFAYREDGLRNGEEPLWEHISINKGTALCNLRRGHIVTLIDSRVCDGERQFLVIDCHSESNHEKVKEEVRQVVSQSRVEWQLRNERGVIIGEEATFALFFVPAAMPMDYTLLHRIA